MTLFTDHQTFEGKDGSVIHLRPVLKEDAKEIIQAANAIVEAKRYIQKEKVRSLEEEHRFINDVQQQGHMYIVIEVNGQVSGIARVLIGELEMKRHIGLFRTWIHPNTQGKGIGHFIMQYTQNWCREKRLHKLCLTVFASNQAAYSLYKKYGFEEEGVQKDQVFVGDHYDDEILMAYFI
ncbi:N-acetyltransferase family protein [Alkalihalobacillus sp. 1P02AB]|uniref:GNAT family N-acetyltransferase n=1 Tax=Alkalihalobacillus sp. 1P02AB TaxID=3132260 RepID=UPI0039A6A066